MERVVATVSAGGVPVAAGVEAWVRAFTAGSGQSGWEGHFESDGGAVLPGEYDLAAADGRAGRIRVTHAGPGGRGRTRADFTGSGPFGRPRTGSGGSAGTARPARPRTMSQTYRVRYSLSLAGRPPGPADVRTADVEGELDQAPGRLPAGAYIMYVEDLTAGRDVHWTRWPKAFRPGFGERPAPAGPAPGG